MSSFEHLGLSSELLKALKDIGFIKPSKIQSQAIPQLIYEEYDFIGLAQTGTGKTAAFGLPLLQKIDTSKKYTQGLILAPTRELGQQITEQLKLFSKYLNRVNVLAVYGGASISNQIKALKKPQHIIVATPGRLIDLIKRKAINISSLNYLILDEADEMLNMGFQKEIDKILSYAPEQKVTWLFSATMAPEIQKIVNQYMTDPIEIKVDNKDKVNRNIEHQYVFLQVKNKTEALMRFLDANSEMRGLVFCRTKRDTQNLADHLVHKKYRAEAIHGDLSQQKRDRVMKRFKTNKLQLLIATDVAARGIDVTDITHVFHYTLPDDNAYYTHRSGRTARAGKKGVSISFVPVNEGYRIKRLEKQLDIKFQRIQIPNSNNIAAIRIENWCYRILNTRVNGNLEPSHREKAQILFGNLSKEELIDKALAIEIEKLNLTIGSDLNEDPVKTMTASKKRKSKRNKYSFQKRNKNHRGKRGKGRRNK